MKKSIHFLLTALTMFLHFGVTAQSSLDSLYSEFNKSKNDTTKLRLRYEIGEAGMILRSGYWDSLKKDAEKHNMQKLVADALNNIGYIYNSEGKIKDALDDHLQSLKISEEIGDKEGIATSFNNIAFVYDKQGQVKEALDYHLKALKIREELHDKRGVARLLNNIGYIYDNQGKIKEALDYYHRSLKISEEIGDKENISTLLGNLGYLAGIQGNIEEALDDYKHALKIQEEIQDKGGEAYSLHDIAGIYLKQKKYKEAEQYSLRSMQIAKDASIIENIRNASQQLSRIYFAEGKYKNAYEMAVQFKQMADSINNQETQKVAVKKQLQYEFEKKEATEKSEQNKKDAIAIEEKQKQKVILIFVLSCLLLVVIFSVFIFRSYRQKRKANIIISEQKQIVEEKQKEIIDSITYAKRLQQAILPSQDMVDAYFPDNFIFYQPKDIVAGDFYWIEKINNMFFIAAADSTGHGVPGAMVSVVCSNALNRTVKEFKETEPGKILDKTRELVLETFGKSTQDVKDGMDISLLCINKTDRKISWSGANNSLWYIQNLIEKPLHAMGSEKYKLTEIKANKQPIGKTEIPRPFTTHSIEYLENTTFYLFTDGYADQFGGEKKFMNENSLGRGKKFKYKKLQELLLTNQNKPLNQQAEILKQTFQNWKGDLEQVDDVCIIGLKI
ncbi:MAG: tetratricopeptide repeat protein [Bacteroidia bacterium]